MNHAKQNLLIHRLLLGLAGVMLVLSLLLIHWYAMFEQHHTALRAHLCAWASLWFGLRMVRHCEYYERWINTWKFLQPWVN